jgi:hypothetical protein
MEEKDGYNVQNLYRLLKDKKKRNLPKDQNDIKIFKNILKIIILNIEIYMMRTKCL